MSTARWKPSPDVVARTLDGNTVLMHLETDQIYELNPTGTRLWELLSAGESLPEAKERLEGEFDAPREVVSDDVDLLLTELVDAGLVVVVKESLTAGEPSPARSAGNAWVLEFEPGRGAPPRLLEAGRDLSIWSGDAMHLWVVGCPLSEGDVAQRGAAGAEFLARRIESSSIDRVIDELRGNFTLVAWLRATDELVVVRDVVGLSPVYYTEEGRTVRLSNDLFELAGRRSAGRTVNRAVVASYVLMSGSHRQVEETFLDGIRRVPPAHLLRVGDRTQCRQYWDSLLSERQVTLNEAIPELESALETAIRRSLRGGADSLALSGGYDSVALAAIAARQCATLSAISLRLPDTDDAEWPVQRGVAAALGFPLAALDAAPRRGDDFVSRALGASRESPSPILSPWQWMFSTLLQGASAASCRGLIMGTGGDELFNVPPEYAADLLTKGDLLGLAEFVRAWARTSPFGWRRIANLVAWRGGLRRLVLSRLEAHGPGLYAWLRARRDWRRWATQLGTDPSLVDELGSIPSQKETSELRTEYRRMRELPALPAELDQAGSWAARHGTQLHYPYFDRDVDELVVNLPPAVLYAGGRMKSPLRALVRRELPDVDFPVRKIDFTATAHSLLRKSGAEFWRGLTGERQLVAQGIVAAGPLEALMADYFAGRIRGQLRRIWGMLSAEAWLRALE